jgi:hypothetical protein
MPVEHRTVTAPVTEVLEQENDVSSGPPLPVSGSMAVPLVELLETTSCPETPASLVGASERLIMVDWPGFNVIGSAELTLKPAPTTVA